MNKIEGLGPNIKALGQDLESKQALSKGGASFMEFLEQGVDKVNSVQKTADQVTADVASGKSENIHEAMIALSHAELSFNFMVQVRNKALEAYQEIMRMQV